MRIAIENVYKQIIEFAKEAEAEKVILFGSRARCENRERSDIDLAIYGCKKFEELKDRLENELWSLLELDIINMDRKNISLELKKEIERDGEVLYEKV